MSIVTGSGSGDKTDDMWTKDELLKDESEKPTHIVRFCFNRNPHILGIPVISCEVISCGLVISCAMLN